MHGKFHYEEGATKILDNAIVLRGSNKRCTLILQQREVVMRNYVNENIGELDGVRNRMVESI